MARRVPRLALAGAGLLAGLVLITPAQALAAGRPTAPATLGQGRESSTAADAVRAVGPPLATGTLAHRLRVYFSRDSTIVLLGVLVVCSLMLVWLRRRSMRPRGPRRNRTAGE